MILHTYAHGNSRGYLGCRSKLIGIVSVLCLKSNDLTKASIHDQGCIGVQRPWSVQYTANRLRYTHGLDGRVLQCSQVPCREALLRIIYQWCMWTYLLCTLSSSRILLVDSAISNSTYKSVNSLHLFFGSTDLLLVHSRGSRSCVFVTIFVDRLRKRRRPGSTLWVC